MDSTQVVAGFTTRLCGHRWKPEEKPRDIGPGEEESVSQRKGLEQLMHAGTATPVTPTPCSVWQRPRGSSTRSRPTCPGPWPLPSWEPSSPLPLVPPSRGMPEPTSKDASDCPKGSCPFGVQLLAVIHEEPGCAAGNQFARALTWHECRFCL